MTVQIDENMSWCILVNNKEVKNDTELLQNLPKTLSDKNVAKFCFKVNVAKVCCGNTDYDDVISQRVDFEDPVAWVESSVGKTKLLKGSFDTIRAVECNYLIFDDDSTICQPCKLFRNNLTKYRARISEQKSKTVDSAVADDSHTNIRYLSIPQLQERIRNLALSKKAAIKKAARYSVIINKMVAEDGVTVDKTQHSLFKEVMEKNAPTFEEGTPQELLWQQQMEHASKCNKRSMRWHPLIIRWCLSIYHSSPAAYRQMASKRNKFIVLPHVNTLKKYINFTEPASGFNPDIIERLVEDSNVESIPEFQKNVCLLFDEIKIKSGLAFKKSSGS